MSRSGVLILLGVLAMLTPISGLPSAFRTLLTIGIGAGVAGVGLSLRARHVLETVSKSVTSPEPVPTSVPHDVSPI